MNNDVQKLKYLIEKYGKNDVINAITTLNEGESVSSDLWSLSPEQKEYIRKGIRKFCNKEFNTPVTGDSWVKSVANGNSQFIDDLADELVSSTNYLSDLYVPLKHFDDVDKFIRDEIIKFAREYIMTNNTLNALK